ncbi:MAG: hypothetical protein ACI8Y8_003892 [Planctomycetota bacterium]|jgi:hypothetical protein
MDPTTAPEPALRGILPEMATCAGDVDRRSGLTEREFREEYLKPKRALILQGEVEQWPAYRKWTWDFFREQYGKLDMPTGVCFGEKQTVPMAEFVDYVLAHAKQQTESPDDEIPRYLEGWYFRDEHAELMQDFRMPPCFGDDWFRTRYPQKIAPNATGILIGSTGSYTKLHADGQYSHNWLAQISGRKRWMLIDGRQIQSVYKTQAEVAGSYEGIDHPDMEAFLEKNEVLYHECVTEPGDLLFFPSRVFHQVVGLEPSISLTHNWFNQSNAARVYWQMFKLRVRGALGRE